MRLCSFRGLDGPVPGLVDGEWVTPLAVGSTVDVIRGRAPEPRGAAVRLADVVLEAPVIPGAAIGIGLNYRAHAIETGMEPPSEPVLFAKLRGAVTRPSGPVTVPRWTTQLDYEGELGVVIGRTARDVTVRSALDHVFGYLVVNDVSARDRQRTEPQWIRAKSGATFMPMGPWITSADEVGDPQDLRIRTWVNGDLRQDTSTAEMIFPVADLVAYVSTVFPLEPGDIITTGTPAGVGVGMVPTRFLAPGDVVRIEIDRVGIIEHAVEAG
ncbi:MAG: FAA hydrolase family protein [Thermoleophilia bacterium]|nr:FAA hydrolase family protein [Thermoleophilia bacterium]